VEAARTAESEHTFKRADQTRRQTLPSVLLRRVKPGRDDNTYQPLSAPERPTIVASRVTEQRQSSPSVPERRRQPNSSVAAPDRHRQRRRPSRRHRRANTMRPSPSLTSRTTTAPPIPSDAGTYNVNGVIPSAPRRANHDGGHPLGEPSLHDNSHSPILAGAGTDNDNRSLPSTQRADHDAAVPQ